MPNNVKTRAPYLRPNSSRLPHSVTRGIWAALCTAFVGVVVGGFAVPFQVNLKACNPSPNAINQLIIAASGNQYAVLDGWFQLAPGGCIEKTARFRFSRPSFLVHTEIPGHEHKIFDHVNASVNQQLRHDGDDSNDQQITDIAASVVPYIGDAFACAPSREALTTQDVHLQPDCPIDSYMAGFSPAFHMGDQSQWYFIWESPNLPLLPAEGGIQQALADASAAAVMLREALDLQLYNEDVWGDQLPFSVGGQLSDLNGPLALGVDIFGVARTTIYDRPMPIKSGDVILRINGNAVFGESDLMQRLIEHGLSRAGGVKVPVQYTILRGDMITEVETTFFFDEHYHRDQADQRGLAFWYGIGDALTFGQTPWAVCYGTNGVIGTLNAFSVVIEWGVSLFEGRDYDDASVWNFGLIDAAECTWQHTQAVGLARQTADDIYINSQWFAIVTPSMFRVAGAKLMGANTARIAGSRALGRRVTHGWLEAGETVLWSLGTSAPDTPLEERLGEAVKLAPFGAAGGFLTSSSFKKANTLKNRGGKR